MAEAADQHGSGQYSPGSTLSGYRVLRSIGAGGTSTVHEAVHIALDKRVAIKTLHPLLAENEEIRARFVQEGRTAARVRHPHIVDITDVGESAGVPYLVMERLHGETLTRLLARQGRLNPAEIAEVMIPVAAALAHAHEAGVVHRDLKPDNIFLTHSANGAIHPKVLDFGISKTTNTAGDASYITQNTFLGTPSYVAPEQITGAGSVDGRADQYSFGIILYELASGQNPFAEHQSLLSVLTAIGEGRYAAPSAHQPDVDPTLEHIALRAMSLDKQHRYHDMVELGSELLQLTDDNQAASWRGWFTANKNSTLISPRLPVDPMPRHAPEQVSTQRAYVAPLINAKANLSKSASAPTEEPTPTGDPPPSTYDTEVSEHFEHASSPPPKLKTGGMPRQLRWLSVALALGTAGVSALLISSRSATPAPQTTAKQLVTLTHKAKPSPSHLPTRAVANASYRVTVLATPPTATIHLDGKLVGTGQLSTALANDQAPHALEIRARGFVPWSGIVSRHANVFNVRLSPLRTQGSANSNKKTQKTHTPVPAAAAPKELPVAPPRLNVGSPNQGPLSSPRTDNRNPWR